MSGVSDQVQHKCQGLYVAKEISQAVHWDGSVATYTKSPWSYINLLGIFLFVQGAVGLPLPENLGYLLIVTCTQSEVPIV